MKKLAKKLSILCMMLVACLTLGVATSCDSINGIVGGITSAVEDTFHECDYVEIMYDENNHWNECDCGEKEDIEKHTYSETVTKQATCTVEGEKQFTCLCGYSYTEAIPATGHTLKDVEGKEATCTEDGYTAYKVCENCDYVEGKEVIEAAHKLVDVEAKAPTCTEDGYTAHKACTECDYTKDKEVLPAAHKLEEKEGKAATCTEDGYTAYKACTECDYVEGKVVLSARGHNLETVEGKAPTCMEDGYKAYQACTECPYEEAKKVIEATGHSLETKAGKEPTCSEEGYTAYKACVNCDYVEGKEVVEKIPHTNEDEDLVCDVCSAYLLPEVGEAFKFVLEQNNLKKTLYFAGSMDGYYYATTELLCEATDLYLETAEGGYYIYFMNGETKNYLYIVVSGTYINVKYGETKDVWTYDEKLGAFVNDVNGTDYYIGTYKEFNTISASKYSFISGNNSTSIGVKNFVVRPFIDNHTCEEVTDEGKEATCTEAGLTDGSHCGICGKVFVKQEKVEALGHTTEKGTCERCGQTIGGEEPDTPDTPDTPVTGGSADFDTIVTAKPVGDSGYTKTYTTTNGWTTVNSAIQTGGATAVNPQFPVVGPDTTHKAVCLNGKTTAVGKVTSPTLKGGIAKLTMNYTKMFTDTKLSVTITITDLTTNAVYTKVVSREVEKDADKYKVWTEEWVLETPVKGDFTIEIVNNCPSNNSKDNKDRLTILDLTWEASATQPETHTHTLTATEAKAATCTEAGNSAYWTCSGCGKYFSDAEGKTEIEENAWVIPATGHTEEVLPAVAATCTETGLTEGKKCSVCNAVIVAQQEIAALGHTEEVVPAVAATCTETGLTEGKKCSVCEATLVEQTVVEALGHDEVAHEAKEVTCTEIGWDAYETCTRCDYTTYIETAALGHNIQEHDAAAPTCTEPGCKAYETCLRCDYTTYEEIPALGHTEEVVPAVAATCTETGLTEGKKCSVCEATLVEQEEVEATGHTLEDVAGKEATCTVAGYTAHKACANCDYVEGKEAIAALGHKDENNDYKCDNCSIKMLPEAGESLTIPQALAIAKLHAHNTYTTQKYYITGIVTNVYNTQYGNLYLKDTDGNQICIYGLYSYDGKIRYDAMPYKPVEGDELTVYTVLGMYNTTPQGKSAWMDEVVAHEHLYVAVVTEATCTKEGYTTHTCSICQGYYVDGEAEALGHTTENGTCERCGQTIGSEAPAYETFTADFNTVTNTNKSYVKSTTTSGWVATNAAVMGGGTTDSNPNFKVLGDAANRGFTLNGKTSAKGKLTSPTLTGGLSKITFGYANVFSESNGVDLTVTVKQNGTTVATKKLDNNSVTQYTAYEFVWDLAEEGVAVTGDFTIEIINNSPSNNSSKNKDRVCIFNLQWTNNPA